MADPWGGEADARSLLDELAELNPRRYREVSVILAEIVALERRLADPDLRVLFDLLRSHLEST
jgi:hypothetical protein